MILHWAISLKGVTQIYFESLNVSLGKIKEFLLASG